MGAVTRRWDPDSSGHLLNFFLIGMPLIACFIGFCFGVYVGRLAARHVDLEKGERVRRGLGEHGEIDPAAENVTPFLAHEPSAADAGAEAAPIPAPEPAFHACPSAAAGRDTPDSIDRHPKLRFEIESGAADPDPGLPARPAGGSRTAGDGAGGTGGAGSASPPLGPAELSHAISVLTEALRVNLGSAEGRATPPVAEAQEPTLRYRADADADFALPPQYRSEWRGSASSSSHTSRASGSFGSGPASSSSRPREKRG